MDKIKINSAEILSTPELGANITLEIDLLRHPEKDYSTGSLTEEGKSALIEKLNNEYSDEKFDTVKCYVSPLLRGQESMEPLESFLKENNIETTIRTKNELAGGLTTVDSEKEPTSKDGESNTNEVLIKDFFDKKFPDYPFGGEDLAGEVDHLIKHLAVLGEHMKSGSKVKFVLISHSGIIEYFTKLIYLKNHPEARPGEVSVSDIGGLVDYTDGPKISITSDKTGMQTALVKFKDMTLSYSLK